ncbi:MAG: c-type cytochrome [Aquabacterium sp.]|jgi:cytochrome c553
MNALPRLPRILGCLIAACFASAALAQDAPVGDPVAGKQKSAMCIGCHGIVGYKSSFPEIYNVPKISGQTAPYLSAALTAYRKGDRKHPTMRGIAISLTDQDIADLSAFYATHGADQRASGPAAAPKPSAEVQALLSRGNCMACHGENMNKPIDPSYPKLAGQPADYLYAALRSYQVEGNPHIGRANAIMQGQVKAFTPAELKAMARYIASLPGDLKTVPQSRFR